MPQNIVQSSISDEIIFFKISLENVGWIRKIKCVSLILKGQTYLMNIILFSSLLVPAITISPLLIVAEVIIKPNLK